MDNNLKRAWRIISPVVFYLIIERIVGFLINFYYIMGRLDEDTAWSDALENQLYQEIYELQNDHAIFISGVVAVLCIFAFYPMVKKEWTKRSYRIEPLKACRLKYFYVAAVSIGFTIAVNLIINAWGMFKHDFDFAKLSQMIYSESIWMQFLVIGFIVPLCEELIFRGVIYERIIQSGSQRWAMILTSIIFAFFHGTWIQILYAFCFSFLLIYAYHRCGTFFAPVLFHILSNMSSLILRQFPPLSTMGYSIGIVIFAMLGTGGLYILKKEKFYRKLYKNDSEVSYN